MKKLGWGLGMSGWLISMLLILQAMCEIFVMVNGSLC